MLLLVIGFLHGLFDQVLNVLKRISDEDCLLLGLNPKYARPDWMILQVLPVPPPPVRPSVMMDTSSRSEVSLIPIYSLRSKINCFVEIFR
jgi:DNA-directed RNA polymerase beta' subunit